jgi:hypothetical protein
VPDWQFAEGGVDCSPQPSHGCVWTQVAMHVQIKFLRLRKPVSLGDRIDNWRASWLGGWDKCRVFFFVVMVEREYEQPVVPCKRACGTIRVCWLQE